MSFIKLFRALNSPIVINENQRDTRNRVEMMFFKLNEMGNKEELPVRVFDCSFGGIKSLNAENCIAVLLNYKSKVKRFKGSIKGQTLLLLGGCRAAPDNLGSLMIPLNEVDNFCNLANMVANTYLE